MSKSTISEQLYPGVKAISGSSRVLEYLRERNGEPVAIRDLKQAFPELKSVSSALSFLRSVGLVDRTGYSLWRAVPVKAERLRAGWAPAKNIPTASLMPQPYRSHTQNHQPQHSEADLMDVLNRVFEEDQPRDDIRYLVLLKKATDPTHIWTVAETQENVIVVEFSEQLNTLITHPRLSSHVKAV